MRNGGILPSDSAYFNQEVALNHLLRGGSGLSSGAGTSVSDSDTAQTLLSANSERKGCVIYNDSTEALYVALGFTASSTSFTYKVVPTGTLELFGDKNFVGSISGIWAANASGAARVTSLEA